MLAAQITINAGQPSRPYPFQKVLIDIQAVKKIPANKDTQAVLNRLRASFTRAVYDELPKDEIGNLKDTAVLDQAALRAVVQAAHEIKALHNQLTHTPHDDLTDDQLGQVSNVIDKTFRLALAFKISNDALISQANAKAQAHQDSLSIYCKNPQCWQINPCMNETCK